MTPSRARLPADAQQQARADRVQVGRVAGDLELADDPRVVGIGEVEHVQRVDLAERDHVAGVADEADGVDVLAAPEAAHPAHVAQAVAVGCEHGDEALAAPTCRPASSHGGDVVLATRRTPSCSDIDHWLSMYPVTAPLAT